MLTYRTGAAGAPFAAAAMAAHLLEQTLPEADMRLAEYYAGGQGTEEALARGMGCVPTVRADVHADLASALAIRPGQFLDEEAVAHLLGGRRADGEEVEGSQRGVRRYEAAEEGKKDRVRISYVDLCFSAPKSASLAWAFAETAAERNTILQAHRDARDEALRYVEREVARAGFGHGGREGEERGHLAWVTFDHFTSRPTVAVTRPDPATGVVATEIHNVRVAGDPQLHSHCVVPNAMVTESGRLVAVNRDLLKNRIHEFGAVYQALLAANLRRAGIDVELCERTRMARLPAIPEAVAEAFAKRTRDAEESARTEARARGLEWDAMPAQDRIDFLKGGAKESRRFKADDLANAEAWKAQAEALGWRHRSAVAYGPPAPVQDRAGRLEHGFQTALPLLSEELERRAVVLGTDARLAAARGLIAAGIETTDDVSALTRAMARRGVEQGGGATRLIWKEGNDGRTKLTTELHVAQERELVGLARAAQADRSDALSPAALAAAVTRSGLDLAGEHGAAQRRAMEALGSGGRFGLAIGVAGAGKTTMLRPLVDAWTGRGSEVWGVADAWRQARALGEAGVEGDRAVALQPFLERVQSGRVTLTPRSVVVLDEVGRVGTRQMLHLLRLQQRDGFRIAAVGDDRQCQSIEAGAIIDLMRKALGEKAVPQILSTVRQRTEREREIAGLFREGKAGQALAKKREDGTAELVPGGYREAVERVAALWQERRDAGQATASGYAVTVSAPTNADARAVSLAIRARRREAGEVGPDLANVPATDQAGATYSLPLADGDRVRLFARTRATFADEAGRRRSANIGDNGSVLEVVKVHPREGLHLRAESGKVGFVSWDALRDAGSGRVRLAHGDCLTIDSSQGLTSDEHINAMPSGSRAVQGFKGYVAESRHRVASWLVSSYGAELREAQDRRPMGLTDPLTEADLWDAVARNLARQPVKESALAFVSDVAREAKRATHALQGGLRVQEARAAGGGAPHTLRRTLDFQMAREAVARLAARLEGAFSMIGVERGMGAFRAAVERLLRAQDQVHRARADAGPRLGPRA
ncbi:MobF family relaxase [Muricoccus radiodurans]|uniref:MobF family relaxase n=1 Tax=Muricoccus radiodurans TaxID=2231721 RepID=UPI003CEAA10D